MLFFELSSLVLAILLFALMLGAAALGAFFGRRARRLPEGLKEPFGVLQGALLGVVGLLLAFGLSLAVSRYEDRRANVVTAANAIGTTYLRAQTLPEPIRSRSLALLVGYTRNAVTISEHVPGSTEARAAAKREGQFERRLWPLAASALNSAPLASAPKLYVETLNEMFDDENARVVALSNRVPTAVFLLEIVGAAIALGLLAAYMAIAGRGEAAILFAAALVAFLLLVTADLDRPTRGLIRVPDTALTDQLASMIEPPAAPAPARSP
jgi:hypothetical protein